MFAVSAKFYVTRWTLSAYPGRFSYGVGVMDLPGGESSASLSRDCLWEGKTAPWEWELNRTLRNKSSCAAAGSFPQTSCSEMIYTKGWLICSCYPILNLTAKEVLGNGYSYWKETLTKMFILPVSRFIYFKQRTVPFTFWLIFKCFL